MKRSIVFLFVFSIFLACNNDISETPINQPDWKPFAKANTDGLKFINNYVQDEISKNGRLSKAQTTQTIISATDHYLELEGVSETKRKSTTDFLNEFLNSEVNVYYDSDVTRMQASFIAALEFLFNQDLNFENTINSINKLEEKAYDLLTREERSLVLMAITTAKSQTSYWYHNKSQVFSNNGRIKCVNSWKNVGKKAIGGALGGAATCYVAAGFGPVGWKAWGACVLGGAAGTAVQEIYEQCVSGNSVYNACKRFAGSNENSGCYKYLNYSDINLEVHPKTLLDIEG